MIILDFYFLGLTYIIVYVGAIMILFLFVIMMVQIHFLPVTLAITPRVVIVDKPLSTSASQLTGQAENGQLALLVPYLSHSVTYHGTDLAITLVMDSGKTNDHA